MAGKKQKQESISTNKKRLIICLDGTWNNKDSSTNINSIYNLVAEHGKDGARQLAYYDEGVGTGVFDGITGGGFGFGLDANIREAYNWLIRNFIEGDEIFIFGFSRGAYTARSLVGFISHCGLLRPGAPMTVKQLWDGYSLLGSARERKKKNGWEKLAGIKEPPFRRISSLAEDWFPPKDSIGTGKQDFHEDLNETERLLVQSSRRVPIHFLGVFDTVGAMGWEALAIPGLRSKLSIVHNIYVSSIIQNCRHALAINENRSSFSHTPIHQWLSNRWEGDKAKKKIKNWENRVHQKWFVGAHSNIGGGYADNHLAQEGLQWMMKEADANGLNFQDAGEVKAEARASIWRDSYSEFAAPLWMHLLRAKRFHRRIAPPLEVIAQTKDYVEPKGDAKPGGGVGYARNYIDEEVDQSTLDLAKEDPTYAPPNLVEYASRMLKEGSSTGGKKLKASYRESLRDIEERTPGCDWLELHDFKETSPPNQANRASRMILARAALIVWASLGAAGLIALIGLINGYASDYFEKASFRWLMALTAFALVLVDWIENRFVTSQAADPENGSIRARMDSAYWARAVGVIFFVSGLVVSVFNIFAVGLGEGGFDAPKASYEAMKEWLPIPVAASLGIFLGDILNRKYRERTISTLITPYAATLVAGIFLLVAGLALSMIGAWGSRILPSMEDCIRDWRQGGNFGRSLQLQGLLLFLQIALLFLHRGFFWVGDPMSSTRMGSIFALQKACSPEKVMKVLDDWKTRLTCNWQTDASQAAMERMQQRVKEALYRDIFGFIPLYAMVLSLGCWILSLISDCPWVSGTCLWIPNWSWILLIAVGADYLENAMHFRFLENFKNGVTPSRGSVAIATVATTVKFTGLLFAVLATGWAAIQLSWDVVTEHRTLNWRGMIAGSIAIIAGVMFISALLIWMINNLVPIVTRIRNRFGRNLSQ